MLDRDRPRKSKRRRVRVETEATPISHSKRFRCGNMKRIRYPVNLMSPMPMVPRMCTLNRRDAKSKVKDPR